MKGIGETHHLFPAGDLARQLERGFHRIGAGRAGELELVVQTARLQDHLVELIDEALLGLAVHVQRMGDAVAHQIAKQGLLDAVRVVTVVENACATEEVQIAAAVGVGHPGALGAAENRRKVAAIATDFRLVLFECIHCVALLLILITATAAST